ncbi:MAG: peptidoglycan-binding protein [Actinobacteria bacterium HGW-Actinobacteria-7]|jgi:peptidoglycan hydrolase-like protein with peptidoglycan-binding domain|nr:MAG: peptidoglycan-binding protein [Actinobacteria bacterium HGW-Actinobacteria-7]
MKPVRVGDRGVAVEDIQRRLRVLGYDLGPTGIDGVFFGRTAEAVLSFRSDSGLGSESAVDEATWAALVDATFTLGDRMLYLKTPYFHGHDVHVLQEALNALGFVCGAADGIFGAFTEGAVREFQRNVGLVPDGIAGAESVRSLFLLRHVWEGKDPAAHSAARTAPARACEGLVRTRLAISGLDATGCSVAERVANLAAATNPQALMSLLEMGAVQPEDTTVSLLLCGEGKTEDVPGRPVVSERAGVTLESRLLAAFESARNRRQEIVIELGDVALESEHELQREAVRLLDALCHVFD